MPARASSGMLLVALLVSACQPGAGPPSASRPAAVPGGTSPGESPSGAGIAAKVETLLERWRVESASIALSSRTDDYLALPAFRALVELGPEAVPYLRRELEADEGSFFLAFAVAEICGWSPDSLRRGPGDQSVRSGVLEQLDSGAPCVRAQ